MNRLNRPDDALEETMRAMANTPIPPEVEERLQSHLQGFRQRLNERPPSWRRGVVRFPLVLRVSAAMICAMLILMTASHFLGSGSMPSWAQVAKKFAGASFFNATIYVKNGALDEPVQLELWMGQNGLMRMRAGNQIIFGKPGMEMEHITLGAPGPRSKEIDNAYAMLQDFVKSVGTTDAFSLDTLIRLLPEKTILAEPMANQNACVSSDLAVFDVAGEKDTGWVRIWALRESRLPVRVLYWNPENSDSIDVEFSYFNQQPKEFFDPAALRESIQKYGSTPDQAYAFLKDPGGRPMTKQEINASSSALPPANKQPL